MTYFDLLWPWWSDFVNIISFALCQYVILTIQCHNICENVRIWCFFLILKKLITPFLVVMETRSDKGANVESESSDPSNLVEYVLNNLHAKFGELFQCLQLLNINKPSNHCCYYYCTISLLATPLYFFNSNRYTTAAIVNVCIFF